MTFPVGFAGNTVIFSPANWIKDAVKSDWQARSIL
jgi:hypothetical protein